MYNVITLPPLTSFFLASTSRPRLPQEKAKRRFSFYINIHTHIYIYKDQTYRRPKSLFAKEVSPGSLRIRARTRLEYETKRVQDKNLIFPGASPNCTTEMSFCFVSAAARALHSSGLVSPIAHAILLVKFAIIHHCKTH